MVSLENQCIYYITKCGYRNINTHIRQIIILAHIHIHIVSTWDVINWKMIELYASQEHAVILTVKFMLADLHIIEVLTVGLSWSLHFPSAFLVWVLKVKKQQSVHVLQGHSFCQMYKIPYGLSEMETVSWISQVFPRRLSSFKLAKLFLECEQFSSSAYFSRFAIVGFKITAAQLWSSCTATTPVGGSRLRWKLIICKQMYTCLEIGFPHLLSMRLLCQSSEYVYELNLPALVFFFFFFYFHALPVSRWLLQFSSKISSCSPVKGARRESHTNAAPGVRCSISSHLKSFFPGYSLCTLMTHPPFTCTSTHAQHLNNTGLSFLDVVHSLLQASICSSSSFWFPTKAVFHWARYHLSLQRSLIFGFQIASSPCAAAVGAEVRFDPPLTDFPLWQVFKMYSTQASSCAMATNAGFLIHFSVTAVVVLYHQRHYEMAMTSDIVVALYQV